MYYIVYETTNKVNGKKYRGAHATEDLNDKYLGSGTAIMRAIKRYGQENFYRSVLEVCKTPEDMYEAEARWVDKEWMCRKDTYNCATGGSGGYRVSDETREKMSIGNKGRVFTEEHRRKLSEAAKRRKPNIEKGHKFGPMSDEEKAKRSKANKGRRPYKMTAETRKKMSEAAKGRTPWNKGKRGTS